MKKCVSTKDTNGDAVWPGDLVAMYGYLDDDGYAVIPEDKDRVWGVVWTMRVEGFSLDGYIRHDDTFWNPHNALLLKRRWFVRFDFVPADFWVGFHYDADEPALFVCPIPTLRLKFRLPKWMRRSARIPKADST